MKFLNRVFLSFGLFVVFLFLFFANVFSFTSIDDVIPTQLGFIYNNIYSPFNVSIVESSKALKSSSPSNYQTHLQNAYSEFNPYLNQASFLNAFVCNIGGDYLIDVISKPTHGAVLGGQSVLFNCKTTLDLISMIKIPTTWTNDNLVLYCNDGKKISSLENNFDFLTTGLNTYKSCILKNLNKGATILYGLDTGNSGLDSNSAFFFNSTTHTGSIISSNFVYNSTVSGVFKFKDKKDNNAYYFNYDFTNKYFSLSNLNLALTTPITNIFTGFNQIGISRVALFRSISGSNIYGYESAASIKIGNNTVINPIYKISWNVNIFPGFNNLDCANYFKKYESKSQVTANILMSDKIVCGNSNILINSKAIDGSSYGKRNGNVNSFNIFKNIILGIN